MGRRSVRVNNIKTPEERINTVKGWITGQCFSYNQLIDIEETISSAMNKFALENPSLDIQEEEWFFPHQHPQEKEERKEIPGWDIPYPKDQKENTMYTQVTVQDEALKTNYLRDRLCEIWSEKYSDLQIQYGLRDDARPQSGTEEVQRIKDGRYKIEASHYGGPDHIRWRDPSKKEDYEGFGIANEKLEKMRKTAKDDIMVQDAVTALATLRTFRDTPVQ